MLAKFPRLRGFVVTRVAGAAVATAGLALIGFGTAGATTVGGLGALTLAASDPGCTPSAAGPGVVVVCLHEDQEGTTATGFDTQSCDNIASRDPSLDYFVFVLPAAGDAGRFFVPPSPTVTFDTGSTTGTIGSNPKFFFASAAPGAVLLEAAAHADNGIGTPTGGEAQVFNLTHTCPATITTTTTSSSSSSGGSSATTSTTTTSSGTAGLSGSSTTTGGTTTSVLASSTATSAAGSGVLGLSTSTPSTGADIAFGLGLLLLAAGGGAIGVSRRRRKK
jgi:hypothetical protein